MINTNKIFLNREFFHNSNMISKTWHYLDIENSSKRLILCLFETMAKILEWIKGWIPSVVGILMMLQ